MVKTEEKAAQLARGTAAWGRAWEDLRRADGLLRGGSATGDVESRNPENGECWQYMGSGPEHHTFRHRSHPTHGSRVYVAIPATVTPEDVYERLDQEGVARDGLWEHFETDGGMEVERDDEFAPPWFTDAHAVLLHRVECGCLCPENKDRPDFYGGRTQMPFPTFSASADDLC